jgi:putative ABC transport system permease protein
LANEGLEVWTWEELNDFYDKTVKLYDQQFGVLRLIVLAMVLLSVANSVNMSVFERVAEFGTMRALGNRSRTVFLLVTIETVFLGVIGASIGVIVGMVSAFAISAIGIPMPPPPHADLGYTARIQLVPGVIFGAFVVGVIATTFAGMFAALRVSRIPVVHALRQAI